MPSAPTGPSRYRPSSPSGSRGTNGAIDRGRSAAGGPDDGCRSRRLAAHAQGVGSAFRPRAVASSQSMRSSGEVGASPASARRTRIRRIDSARPSQAPLGGVDGGTTPWASRHGTRAGALWPVRLSRPGSRRRGGRRPGGANGMVRPSCQRARAARRSASDRAGGSGGGAGNRRQLGLRPGAQHRVGGARAALDPDPARGRVEQRQRLGRAVAGVLVGGAGRAGRRPPAGPGLRDRPVRPGLVPGPGRPRGPGVRPLDRPRCTVACGAWPSTSPGRRRRRAGPVWPHARSRRQPGSAACSTPRMGGVPTSGRPSAAVRGARRSVVTARGAVRSTARSGPRRASAGLRSRSTAPSLALGPPPWRGSPAAGPARSKRAASSATASPERRPTRRAAAASEHPAATATNARARATTPAGALVARPNSSSPARSSAVRARSASFRRRPIPALPDDGIPQLDRNGHFHAT